MNAAVEDLNARLERTTDPAARAALKDLVNQALEAEAIHAAAKTLRDEDAARAAAAAHAADLDASDAEVVALDMEHRRALQTFLRARAAAELASSAMLAVAQRRADAEASGRSLRGANRDVVFAPRAHVLAASAWGKVRAAVRDGASAEKIEEVIAATVRAVVPPPASGPMRASFAPLVAPPPPGVADVRWSAAR